MVQKLFEDSQGVNENYICYQILIWQVERGRTYPRVLYGYANSKKAVKAMIEKNFPKNQGFLIRKMLNPSQNL
jgi:hypothetical protein